MEMTKLTVSAPVAFAALAFVVVFAATFAIVPLTIAASSGSDYPIEITRAHTVYKVADPAPLVTVGLGVQGNR